ncbi:hypothetical protein D3P07_19200 [Paenibacillus sp. 1011MAR3C5]|uniref:VOC family protein n=1 Tax=Paenibacillus sp. 1011MAR3C5 TaxID=1675787 RepID=UPI000E6CEF7A|nr:VOC family protein [Paenibacillus sp. 1011MAR3C5]RJE86204.1 hypothetical protein D3P07_19200 [Paenibacillus sp. 1011MAR3C5]
MMDEAKRANGSEAEPDQAERRWHVSGLAAIEIPVSSLRSSMDWYGEMLGAKPEALWQEGDRFAMLHFRDNPVAAGSPALYLVETDDKARLTFNSTRYGYTHSVVDLYTHDLQGYYSFLRERHADVNEVDWEKEPYRQGFGFRDMDGNSLGVCKAEHAEGNDRAQLDGFKGHSYIWGVAGVEIPVTDLRKSIEWYTSVFGLRLLDEPSGNGESAMLYLNEGGRLSGPYIYLVETEDERRLAFRQSDTKVVHSVIDFCTDHVESMLEQLRGRGIQMNGISGFYDPEGNSLAICSM